MSYSERPYWDWGNYEVHTYDLILYFVITAMAFFYGRSCFVVGDHSETWQIMRYSLGTHLFCKIQQSAIHDVSKLYFESILSGSICQRGWLQLFHFVEKSCISPVLNLASV